MPYVNINDEFVLAGNPELMHSSILIADTDPAVIAYLAATAEAAKPKEVTMRQARLVLLQSGLLTLVEAAVAGLPGAAGQAALIEWEYSNTLRRNQPLVTQLGAALGLNSAQLDTLFLTAATL